MLTVLRKQNCSLSFVKSNDTVELSLSKLRGMTLKVDPTMLDDLVVDDMMIL